MGDRTGRVAIVTGVASDKGQGFASARVLAEHGAKVVICDIDGEGCAARAKQLVADGHEVVAVTADVRVEADVARVVATAVEHVGRIDILHSQAANLRELADPGDGGVVDTDVRLWHSQFDAIALGALLFCKHVIPEMAKTGRGGSIICTTSTSGQVGEPSLTVYGSAKAAVNQLARSVAAQWGKQDTRRCNAIAPGLVLTQPALDLGPEAVQMYTRHCDLPYVAHPVDVADVVAFLASDLSRAITGEVIRVDSGFSSHSPMLAEQLDAMSQA